AELTVGAVGEFRARCISQRAEAGGGVLGEQVRNRIDALVGQHDVLQAACQQCALLLRQGGQLFRQRSESALQVDQQLGQAGSASLDRCGLLGLEAGFNGGGQ